MEGMISHYAKCLHGIICKGSGISCANLQASDLAPPQKIKSRASSPILVRRFKMTLQIMVLNCWVFVSFFACRVSAI